MPGPFPRAIVGVASADSTLYACRSGSESMKFLCPSCKAKYQIADEKVAGRTLRMSCRQCKEQIVIRGDPVSMAPGSAVSKMPSPPPGALGADFQRQVAGGASLTPDTGGLDEWHVAINDIPVGPMGRQEVARKISMGAVGPDSLAWREGLDDWLPVRHIAELAVLCKGPPAPASTPQPGAIPAAAPAPVPPAVAPPAVAPPAVAPPPPMAAAPQAPLPSAAAAAPQAVPSAMAPPVQPAPFDPAARAGAAPLGGRHGANAAEAPAEAPAVPISESIASQPRPYTNEGDGLGRAPKTSLSAAQMFLLVCGGAFILTMGALLGARLVPQQSAVAPTATAPQPTVVPDPTVKVSAEPEAIAGNTIELDLQEIDGEAEQKAAAKRKASSRASKSSSGSAEDTGSAAVSAKAKQLTAAEKAKLARMGRGLNHSATDILKGSRTGNTASGGKGKLTAKQLSRVVSKGKRSLQRCYEAALRGSGSDEAVRMDIELTVSSSGNVSRVSTRGKGLPGMNKCITRTVRMWRFPASAKSTVTKFPLVFQPGA